MEQTENEVSGDGSAVVDAGQSDNGKPLIEEQAVKRSSWSLVQCEEFTEDIQEYRRRRRKALLEALIALREGRTLSRRVISIWAYQRCELRWAS